MISDYCVFLLREVKVHVSKPGSVGRFMSTLTKKKYNTDTETFRLSLKKTQVSCMFVCMMVMVMNVHIACARAIHVHVVHVGFTSNNSYHWLIELP